MTDKEKRIFKTFADLIPKLPESGQDYFLGVCGGSRNNVKSAGNSKRAGSRGSVIFWNGREG